MIAPCARLDFAVKTVSFGINPDTAWLSQSDGECYLLDEIAPPLSFMAVRTRRITNLCTSETQ